MSREYFSRTISFRFAESPNSFGADTGGPGTLQGLLEFFHNSSPTIADRTARYEGKTIEARNIGYTPQGYLLMHFVAYTVDDNMPVVPDAQAKPEGGIALTPPPEDSEFLDGELYWFPKMMCLLSNLA